MFGLLAGCKMVLLDPAGDVAVQQRDIIIISTGLMLLIVLPVILLTLVFAWWYRESNVDAVYDPEWHHSTQLEVLIWSAPLAIIIGLGLLTWIATHLLDPWRSVERIDRAHAVAAEVKPLPVQVVALDWKWLFIYPEQGIATVNELAAPVNVPITFSITSSAVFNSFFVPALAGQVYAMPGMQTKLHAVLNKPGEYTGISANYSGRGFSDMHFAFHGLSDADFAQWVQKVKADGGSLTRKDYLELEQPSEREPVHHYRSVEPGLFAAVVNMCVDSSEACKSDMRHAGGHRAASRGGAAVPATLAEAKADGPPAAGVTGAAICTASNASGLSGARKLARQAELTD